MADIVGPVIGTTVEYFCIFCGIINVAMTFNANSTSIDTHFHNIYLPLFYIGIVIGSVVIATLIILFLDDGYETEDHSFVEN